MTIFEHRVSYICIFNYGIYSWDWDVSYITFIFYKLWYSKTNSSLRTTLLAQSLISPISDKWDKLTG